MRDLTASEVTQALLREPAVGDAELRRRVEALTTVLLDLMTEVEALRDARAEGSDYRDSYRRACLLTHDSTGPSSGWEKLIRCFYPSAKSPRGGVWREAVMMARLGYLPAEIDAYREEASAAEMRT